MARGLLNPRRRHASQKSAYLGRIFRIGLGDLEVKETLPRREGPLNRRSAGRNGTADGRPGIHLSRAGPGAPQKREKASKAAGANSAAPLAPKGDALAF